jgi:hypothetical protein
MCCSKEKPTNSADNKPIKKLFDHKFNLKIFSLLFPFFVFLVSIDKQDKGLRKNYRYRN